MSDETKRRLYDAVVPGWRSAPPRRGERIVRCPLHADKSPSLSINETKLTWFCFPCCEGGGAWDLAQRVLGEDGVREILRASDPPRMHCPPQPIQTPKPVRLPPTLMDLGPVPDEWVDGLICANRIRSAGVLLVAEARKVQVRWRNKETGGLREPCEYLGFRGLGGDWQVWDVQSGFEKPQKLNAGPADLMVSPSIEAPDARRIPDLWDVEGVSDLLAALEAGAVHVVAGNTGAGSLKGHERHRNRLRQLTIGRVVVARDADQAGAKGAAKAAEWWARLGVRVRIWPNPGPQGSGADLRDFLFGLDVDHAA